LASSKIRAGGLSGSFSLFRLAYRNLFNKNEDEMDAIVQQSEQFPENLNRSDKQP